MGIRDYCGGMHVREHLLNRHGVKWPPGFFSGQKGCQCCPPPPPPPPPPPAIAAQYYYFNIPGTRCYCNSCETNGYGGSVPCAWLLEVDGITNGSSSGDCAGTTGCERSNGTFILRPYYVDGWRSACVWESPRFLGSGLADGYSVLNDCPLCRADQFMYYSLWFYFDSGVHDGRDVIELYLYGTIGNTSFQQARWKKFLQPEDRCDQVHALTIDMDFQQNVGTVGNPNVKNGCCHGSPQFVNIVPL